MSKKDEFIIGQKRELYERMANQTDKSLWKGAAMRAAFFLAIFLVFDYATKRNIFSEDYEGTIFTSLLQIALWYAMIVVIAYWFGRFERRSAAKRLEDLNNDR